MLFRSAALTGAPKKRKRKGGALITLGVLAAVGAGVAYWLAQQSKAPATDPWAQPSAAGADTDPWASTAPTSEVPGTPGATMPATGGTAAAPLADAHLADSEVAAGSTAPVSTTSTSGSQDPKMLPTETIDELASDDGVPVEEQGQGETPAEEIEAARAKADQPLAGDSAKDGKDPDAPRA